MMSSEPVINDTVPLEEGEGSKSKSHQRVIPQFFPDSQKRKHSEENVYETPAKTPRFVIPEMDKQHAPILKQILEMLKLIDTRVTAIETATSTIKDEILIRQAPINMENKLDKLVEDLDLVKKELLNQPKGEKECSTQDALLSIETEMEVDRKSQEINAQEYIADWETCLKRRKVAFNKHLTNHGRREIHIDWKNRDPPFIPAAYLPKQMKFGESQREYDLRKNQKESELEVYLDLLAIRAEQGYSEFEGLDNLIEERISNLDFEEDIKDRLREEYRKKVVADEETCQKSWDSTAKGLETKPKRESDNKIVMEKGRIYAKGKPSKKEKVTNETNGKTDQKKPDPPVHNSVQPNTSKSEVKSTPATKKRSGSKRWGKPHLNKVQYPSYVQPQVISYQPMASYQQHTSNQYPALPISQMNLAQPPPLINNPSPNVSFPLANQQNQWSAQR